MKGRFFVTATDTGVGKTYVLSLILRFLVEKGIKPSVMKPVETGCVVKYGMLIPEDAERLAKIVGAENSLEHICPFRFETPVAPYVASQLEKKEIDVEKIKKIAGLFPEPLFVEGAGGLMVPVLKNFFMIDLIKLLNTEVIFVAPLRLGTINHTLLSIEALEKRGIKIKGIILNDTEGLENMATKTNPSVLSELQPYPILAIVKRCQNRLNDDFSL